MLTHANTHARSSAARIEDPPRRQVGRWPSAAASGHRRRRRRQSGAGHSAHAASNYQFQTLNNSGDPTFNQLLGINQDGQVAGYFGSGAKGHPNKGYLLTTPSRSAPHYRSENWPESTQTQVTGLNDRGVTVGFWSTTNTADPATNDNRAFVSVHGLLHQRRLPHRQPRPLRPSTSCSASMTTTSRSGSTTTATATPTPTSSTSDTTSSWSSHRPASRTRRPPRSTTGATSPGSAPTPRATRRTARSSATCCAATVR